MRRWVTSESKLYFGQRFQLRVKLEADDWRQAQVLVRLVGNGDYFETKVEKRGFIFLLSSAQFLQITNNGKKTKDKFTAADKRRVGSTLKAYAELALKDPTKEFPDETKNLDFDTLKGIASSCYHLAPLAGADKAKFADVGYQCSCAIDPCLFFSRTRRTTQP